MLRFPHLFGNSAIIPLPIKSFPSLYSPRKLSNQIKIISVGRYTPFKAYNISASQIIEECNCLGIDISWVFYGWGPLKTQMEQIVVSSNKADRIKIFGQLNYREFFSVVKEFDLFLGMGTSALEASSIGVPTIVAVDGNKYLTYGFISELPFGNVGEILDIPPIKRISECIKGFAALSSDQKSMLSHACRKASQRYSIGGYHDCLSALSGRRDKKEVKPFVMAMVVTYCKTLMLLANFALFLRKLFSPKLWYRIINRNSCHV